MFVQDVWDSYIQGPNTGLDTSNNFLPMDLGSMPMQTDTTGLPHDMSSSQQGSGQQQMRTAFGPSILMDVSTYPYLVVD